MTVEPQAHPSPVPLDLVDGFETLPRAADQELRTTSAAAIQAVNGEALASTAIRRKTWER